VVLGCLPRLDAHTGDFGHQFQRQLGLKRYETAFQILHKLRAGMVRPERDRIGGDSENHVELDETLVGGATGGLGGGVHDLSLVVAAVEVRGRKPKANGQVLRRHGRYAGRVRLEIMPDQSAKSLVGFVEAAELARSQLASHHRYPHPGTVKRRRRMTAGLSIANTCGTESMSSANASRTCRMGLSAPTSRRSFTTCMKHESSAGTMEIELRAADDIS
jgi:hypothetical protein